MIYRLNLRSSFSIEKKKKIVLREKIVYERIGMKFLFYKFLGGKYRISGSLKKKIIVLVRYVKGDLNVLRGILCFWMESYMEI